MLKNNLWMSFIRTWQAHTAMQMATLAVLVGTYSVVAVSLIVHQNLDRILTQWGDSVQLSVYLQDSISEADRAKVHEMLTTAKDVQEVKYISKQQAAEQFQSQLGHYVPDALFNEKFGNPLPSSFEASVEKGLTGDVLFASLQAIADLVAKLPGVEDVSFGQDWVSNYASVVESFSVTSIVLILILLVGSLFVVGNSIRSSIYQRRDEIEILELVGGTRSYIQAPYLFEGAMMGFLSSLAAVVLTGFVYSWQASFMGEQMGAWAVGSSIQFLSPLKIAFVLCLGTFVGVLGSYMCVRKVSTGWAAAERNL